jgi:ligand-binding sensor domain-containing protein/serine phosphatase RsbU (regulator of sigma subunit)
MQDKEGNIWVGTDNGGLCVFIRKTKKFIRFPKLLWKEEMFKIQSISSLLQDSNGNIWFSNSQFQYFILNYKTHVIHPMKYDLMERLPNYYRVTNMFEDKNKTVWLATQFGLFYAMANYKEANGTILVNKIFKKIPEYSFQNLEPNRNSKDSIYLITNEGLILSYNVNNSSYRQEFKSINEYLNRINESVQSAVTDQQGNWWIGTYKSGLLMYDRKTGDIHCFKQEVYDNNSLRFNFINKVYEDASGLIWICTGGGGLDLINPGAAIFNVYQHQLFNKNSICNNDVWSVFSNDDFTLAGTTSGLAFFDKKKQEFKKYDFQSNEQLAHEVAVYHCIKRDEQGNIWIGADAEGLLKFNPANGKMEKLEIINYNDLGIDGYSAFCVAFNGNEIWIGTSDHGLIRYNRETKMAKQYRHSAARGCIAQNSISALLFSDDNTLWIATQDNGINRFDINKEHFTWISTVSKNTGHLSSDVAVGLMKDSYGTIWVATERGINAINTANNKVYGFNQTAAGSVDVIYGMIEDAAHHLWFSSNKGIYTFQIPKPMVLFGSSLEADKIIAGTLRNFDESDGLPSNEFNQGSCFMDSMGVIYFGGINGLVYFNPATVRNTKNNPAFLYLQSFNVFEKRLEFDSIFDKKKLITLQYYQNYFSIEYVSPVYLNPNKIRYSYMLEGLDKSWSTADYQYKISYINVPPGEYIFKLRVTDSNGKWVNNAKSFRIIITPPFWRTNWFYIITAVSAIVLLTILTRLRERKLRREKKILEEKVKIRTKDLMHQKSMVEKKSSQLEQALNSINENIDYSEKIKNAILPDLSEIKKLFPETFLIYNARMVVGGDFYFFARQETAKKQPKFAVIGIADATGHGVSGALMSVVGLTLLNEIVNLKGISKPAHVLDELQLGVKETLRINESNNYEAESIECAICKFDFEKHLLEYAGARLPVYIVRNQEIIELKGDRMRIGAGSANMYERYTEHTFQLQHGDQIYLCTDGFANQFGGDKGKKFKTKRLKNMLLSLHITSHIVQDEQINLIFNNWRGTQDRVDDVLILGIKYRVSPEK